MVAVHTQPLLTQKSVHCTYLHRNRVPKYSINCTVWVSLCPLLPHVLVLACPEWTLIRASAVVPHPPQCLTERVSFDAFLLITDVNGAYELLQASHQLFSDFSHHQGV